MKKIHSHNSSSPKQVFLHLLLIGMLYMSVIALIQLMFAYIDLAIIDPLKYTDYWSASSSYDTVRWTSSVLLVCWPVYLFLSRFLYKEIDNDPDLQHLWIRRWLLSFTLFIAAITMIGSFISVIYNFYSGDLTATFAWQIMTLIVISASIFGYYRWDMQRDVTKKTSTLRAISIATLCVMLGVIIAGFFIAGSPMKQRNVRFDEQRISDLQNIQSEITRYYTQQSALPKTLTDLSDDFYGYIAPTDPATGDEYEYTQVSTTSFELCATFATDGSYSIVNTKRTKYFDNVTSGYRAYTDQWQHTASRTCFSRTIDHDYFTASPAEAK